MLEDGHCLKDHALSACNRPELRAEAQMLGTSLHMLVQMVDNDLGVTLLPEMAIDAGPLRCTSVVARPLGADRAFGEVPSGCRPNRPRPKGFLLFPGELTAPRHVKGGGEATVGGVVRQEDEQAGK